MIKNRMKSGGKSGCLRVGGGQAQAGPAAFIWNTLLSPSSLLESSSI
jgi:hypothetical protein